MSCNELIYVKCLGLIEFRNMLAISQDSHLTIFYSFAIQLWNFI